MLCEEEEAADTFANDVLILVLMEDALRGVIVDLYNVEGYVLILVLMYCCPIKVFQRKKSRLFHRTANFPACQISDYSRESIKCQL